MITARLNRSDPIASKKRNGEGGEGTVKEVSLDPNRQYRDRVLVIGFIG